MISGISIPWYEMSCSYGTAIVDAIPKAYSSLDHILKLNEDSKMNHDN